jgi:8-oxo-dGTP diphosphatase
VTGWTGTPPATNEEGALEWVPRLDLLRACVADPRPGSPEAEAMARLPMWDGDRHFVPLVFDGEPGAFHGTMPYDGDRPVAWNYERI